MPTETIFYLKCFLKRRISIVSNLFGSSIHNCTDCSLGNTCQSRSHALATYSNFQNYRQCPSVPNQPTQSRWLTHKSAQETVLGNGRQYTCSRRIFLRSPRRCVFFRSSRPTTLWLHCAAFCPFFSSPCDTLYHFLLQLSRVTAILKVAIIKIL